MTKIAPMNVELKDGTEIILRSPEISDASAFIEYGRDIFATSPFVITEPDEYEADVEKHKKWIQGFDRNDAVCIIAELSGQIIGNLDFQNRAGRRRIQHRGAFGMGVRSQWRGRGVGRALLSQLIRWGKDSANKIEKIELSVLEKNSAAIKLYHSMGFVEEGRIYREVKLADQSYIDGIAMGLWL